MVRPGNRSAPQPASSPGTPAATPGPRLSIALCTYNGARFLGELLRSLASQTRLPDELVACDDGSTDSTLSVLEEFARRAPFPVRIERNPATLGSTGNFEKAIGLCTGDLISLCDQDDVWMPQKVRLTLDAFEEEPRAGLVFTDAEVVDDSLRPRGHRLWDAHRFGHAQRRQVRAGSAFRLLLRQDVVTGATLTFRARFRPLTRPFPPSWVHDAWIAAIVAAVAPIALVEEPTLLYRQHANQQIGAARPTFLGDWRRARRAGASEYRAELARFRALHERLASQASGTVDQAQVEAAAGKVAHQALRLAVAESSSRIRRITLALRELASGGYARFSARGHYVLKDLFL